MNAAELDRLESNAERESGDEIAETEKQECSAVDNRYCHHRADRNRFVGADSLSKAGKPRQRKMRKKPPKKIKANPTT